MKKIISLLMAILLVTSIGAFRISAEATYVAVQNPDGSITISHTGNPDGRLKGYENPTFTDKDKDIQYYKNNQNFNDLEAQINASRYYVNVNGVPEGTFGCWAYDLKACDGETNNIVYDEETDSVILTAEWVNSTLRDGFYTFEVWDGINWSQTSSIEIKVVNNGGNDNHNDYYYEIPDGDYSFRYGIYFYEENGMLGSTIWGDCTEQAGTITDVILGVGSYEKGQADNSAPPANNSFYQKIDKDSVYAYVVNGNKEEVSKSVVSLSNVQAVTLLDRNTYKYDVTFSENAEGVYYVYIAFKLVGDNTEHKVYRKYIINNSGPIGLDINMENRSLSDLSDELNNIYEKANITPVFGPQGSRSITINLVNVKDEIYDGDIIINMSPNNNMDFNEYIINGNGIKMNGSIINKGKTPMALKNITMDGSSNTNANIAVYPEVGDISIFNFSISNYNYGVYTQKSDGSTWAGNCFRIMDSTFNNCRESAIVMGNDRIYNGMNAIPHYVGNTFIRSKETIVINEVEKQTNPMSIDISGNYFLDINGKDFVVNYTSDKDEYFVFTNNYYSNQNSISNADYRSAKISKSGNNIVVSTSPAIMFPDSEVAKIGIDSQADIITAMFSGVKYDINANSSLRNAVIVLFDPKTSLPVGTAKIKGEN